MKIFLAFFYLLLATGAACSAAQAERAVWMWEEDSYTMLEDTAAAKEAIEFLQSENIRTIYLYGDAFKKRNLITSRPDLYQNLIRLLHGKGMRAYALLGSYYLHTEEYILPRRQKKAVAMLKRVLKYNAASKPEERFDGVNLDIEPHILDQWPARKNELLLNFLDLGRKLMAAKEASGQRLAVGPAIPFWLDGVKLVWNGSEKPVSEHTQDIYDYVALMDYRDHAEGRDGLISHAETELKYAAKTGRKVIIGVETGKNEIKKVSFYHLKKEDMERELGLAEKAFAPGPAFDGFVIHHYRTYRSWLQSQTSKN